MVVHDCREMSHAVPSSPALSQPTCVSSPTEACSALAPASSQSALPSPTPAFLPCDRLGTPQTSGGIR